MKAMVTIQRVFLAGVVALTLGLGLAPRAQAATIEHAAMRASVTVVDTQTEKPKAGEETHG